MSVKIDFNDPAANEYADILELAHELSEKMVTAYNRADYDAVSRVENEISKLYAPSDDHAAQRIAYLIKVIASAHYYGGRMHQIDLTAEKHAKERAKERTLKFTPPF
jgi:hypothetical protein